MKSSVFLPQMTPPFIPEIRSPTDTQHFDKEFKDVIITPPGSHNSLVSIQEQDEPFLVRRLAIM